MTADAQRRRPRFAPLALFALICAALLVPLFLTGSQGDFSSGGKVSAASRDTVTITAPVTVLSSPRVVVERGAITLTAAGGGGSTRESALLALITGGGADLILDGAKVVVGQPAGAGYAAVSSATAEAAVVSPAGDSSAVAVGPIVEALAGLSFHTLYLNDVTTIVHIAGGADQVLRDVDGEIAHDHKGAIRAKVKFELRGDAIQLDAVLSPSGESTDAPRLIRIAVKGRHIDAKLEGRLAKSGGRLQITAQNADLSVPNLRQAARWLDSEWPSGQGLGDFSIHGPVTIDESSIAFDNASVALDGNVATGALSLTLEHERPAIEGTLAFVNLDVAPYVSLAKTDTLAIAANWLSHLPIPGLQSSSLIRALDADLRISARSVAVGSDTFGRCAASLSIKNGKLFGELAEMELEHGGTGEGQLTIDMTRAEPVYNVRATLEDLDVGKAIGTRLGGSGLEGVGKLSFDLSGDGGTESAIVSSLHGTITLDMPEGAHIGLDRDALAKAAAPGEPIAGWASITGKSTVVDTLKARFAATRGVFTAETLEAETPERIIKAMGTVSADDQSIDMTISLVPGSTAMQPADAAPEAAFAPAVRIQGPWSEPLISPVTPPGKSAQPLPPDGALPAAPSEGVQPEQNRG